MQPAIGEVAAHLPQMDLSEVGSTMEEFAFAVSLDHGLVGFAAHDNRGLFVGRVDAEADRNGIAVEDLLAVSIDQVDAQVEVSFFVELLVEGFGQSHRIAIFLAAEEA